MDRGSLRKEDLKALLIGVAPEECEETWGEGGAPLEWPDSCFSAWRGFRYEMCHAEEWKQRNQCPWRRLLLKGP